MSELLRIRAGDSDFSVTVGRSTAGFVYGTRSLPEDIDGIPAFIMDTTPLLVNQMSGMVQKDSSQVFTYGGSDGRNLISRSEMIPKGQFSFTRSDISVTRNEEDHGDGTATRTTTKDFDVAGTIRRVTGDVHVSVELGQDSLGSIIPGVDIHVGDRILLEVWQQTLELVVASYRHSSTGWSMTVESAVQAPTLSKTNDMVQRTPSERIEQLSKEVRDLKADHESDSGISSGDGGSGSGVVRVEKGSDGKITVVYSEGPDDVFEADIADITLDGSELVLKKGEEEFKRIPLPSGGGGGGGDITENHILTAIRDLSRQSHPTAFGRFSGSAKRHGEATPNLSGNKANDFSLPIRGYSGYPPNAEQMIKAAPFSVVALIRAWKVDAYSQEKQMDPENTAFFMVKMDKDINSEGVAHYSLKRHGSVSIGEGSGSGPDHWWSTNALARIAPHEQQEYRTHPTRMRIIGADGEPWTGDIGITIIPVSIYPDDRSGFYPNPRDLLNETSSWLFP